MEGEVMYVYEEKVALEVNLSLPKFSDKKCLSSTVALFANCTFMLKEDKNGFSSEKQYFDYIARCGSAMIIRDSKDRK